MKLHILAIGKLKKSPIKELCEEYKKRLTWPLKLYELPAQKNNTPEQDKKAFLSKIPNNGFIIALDERGLSLESPVFAQKLISWREKASQQELFFLIGGADGLAPEIRKKAKIILSFGQQTWPHMLVRVMLLEQLYRAQQILARHPYHRS